MSQERMDLFLRENQIFFDGKQPFKCPNCEGNGRIDIQRFNRHGDPFIENDAKCPSCQGKGLAWRE